MNAVLQNILKTGLEYNFVLNIFLNLRNLYTCLSCNGDLFYPHCSEASRRKALF